MTPARAKGTTALDIPPGALDTVDDLDRLRRAGAQMTAVGGDPAWLAGLIASRLEAIPGLRLARRDGALLELAAHYPGSDHKRALDMASALLRYQATRWRTERMATQPQEIGGSEGAALFAVMKNSPASGAPRERTIRAILGKSSGLSVANGRAHSSIRSKRESRMTDQIRPAEVQALVALARAPAALKAVEEAHARLVADRQARNDRIAALDKQAAIDWPAGQAAIAKAIKKVRDIERMLLAANDELRSANSDAFNNSNKYTRSRHEEEAAPIERADLPAIAAWKNDLLNELAALQRPSVIVRSQTVERSEVTRKEIRNGFSNIKSINARMAAVRKSYEEADELKLESDQRRLPAIIAEIRAKWPAVDLNPAAAQPAKG